MKEKTIKDKGHRTNSLMMAGRFVLLLLCVLAAGSATGQKVEKLRVERLPDLNIARFGHNIFYAGGELTVVGGHTSGFVPTPTAEYYRDGAWHLVNTVYPHDNGMAVLLDGGRRVLIAGGHEKNLGIGQTFEAEMYYPATHSFDGFSCLDRRRAFSQGVELDDGQVLIVGNAKDNDAIEIFDGQKTFHHLKDVSVWRSMPYVLPISNGDVLVFGSVWDGQRKLPCDIVDRLDGEPFRVPLLGEWIPLLEDQNSHAAESFAGNKSTGEYRYLFVAYNNEEELAIINVEDTVFSLLPTACPLPKMFFNKVYLQPAIVDTNSHRLYLVSYDTTSRVTVVAVEYDKSPAPVTFHVSDSLSGFGYGTPVLTPDGDLIVAGGINNDNFCPFATVWLLKMGTGERPAPVGRNRLPIIICIILIITAIGALLIARRQRRDVPAPAKSNSDEADAGEKDNELMGRIAQVMDTRQLYLNPDLKVSDMAEVLGVHRNTVSACINSHQGCTFSQYVNEYRLRHAKRLLMEQGGMKMAAVGMESGFANERSFFRSFKSATGLTPREWQSQQGKPI